VIAPDPKSPTSGAQHEIRFGDHAAVITELGATLRSFTSNGHDVVDGFSVDEPSPAGRGQVLAPWPNRLEDGTTCPPNAFHTGTDCVGLTPGVPWRAGWGIDPWPTTGTTS